MASEDGKYDTGKLAAMRAMEIDWGWNYQKGEVRPNPDGEYLDKEEAAAIAQYALKFGVWPPSGITKDQRRRIRQKFDVPSHIVP